MFRRISTILRDEHGATAIEYGLIASLIVVAIITVLSQVASTTTNMWGDVANQVTEVD